MANEIKETGKKYRIWDEATKMWKRLSFWTKACDVEFADGKTAEDKIGKLKGVTTATTISGSGYLQDAMVTQGQIDALNLGLSGKAAQGHAHDDRYYTETEIDTKLGAVAATVSKEISTVADTALKDINAVNKSLEESKFALDNKMREHANTGASNTAYGHVKLSDNTGIAATPYYVDIACRTINNDINQILTGGMAANKMVIGNLLLEGNLIHSKSTSTPLVFISGKDTQLEFGSNGLRAYKELTLGNSTHKWGTIYSTSAQISTSDRNKKKDINYLNRSDKAKKYEDLYMKLNPCTYMFSKPTSDRIHTGFISQDIEDSLAEAGLTAMDFAAFCKDKKVVVSTDSEGNKIETEIPGEYEYALRYEEFIALNTHMIQKALQQINKLEQKLADAEKRIAELESAK